MMPSPAPVWDFDHRQAAPTPVRVEVLDVYRDRYGWMVRVRSPNGEVYSVSALLLDDTEPEATSRCIRHCLAAANDAEARGRTERAAGLRRHAGRLGLRLMRGTP